MNFNRILSTFLGTISWLIYEMSHNNIHYILMKTKRKVAYICKSNKCHSLHFASKRWSGTHPDCWRTSPSRRRCPSSLPETGREPWVETWPESERFCAAASRAPPSARTDSTSWTSQRSCRPALETGCLASSSRIALIANLERQTTSTPTTDVRAEIGNERH